MQAGHPGDKLPYLGISTYLLDSGSFSISSFIVQDEGECPMDRRNQIPAEFIWLLHPLRRLKIYQHILFPSYEEKATNWTTPGMFLKSQVKLKSRHTSGN